MALVVGPKLGTERPTFICHYPASQASLARLKPGYPRVAARLDSGVASDCTILELTASSLKARRPLYAGKCSAEVEFVNSPVKFVLMRPNQLPVGAADSAATTTVKDFPAPPASGKIKCRAHRNKKALGAIEQF